MGVVTTGSIVYGALLDYEAMKSSLGEDHDLVQDFETVLNKMYPSLRYELSGNCWTGKSKQWVVLKSSVIKLRDDYGIWYKEIDDSVLDISNHEDEMAEFWKFSQETAGITSHPSWNLLLTYS